MGDLATAAIALHHRHRCCHRCCQRGVRRSMDAVNPRQTHVVVRCPRSPPVVVTLDRRCVANRSEDALLCIRDIWDVIFGCQ
jgi:hypothetical protein